MDKYLALAWLRSILALRSLRGKFSQVLAGWILAGLVGVMSLAVALAVGFLTYAAHVPEAKDQYHGLFLILFWVIFGFGVVLPLMRGQFQESFDYRALLVFPISEKKLFNLTVISSFLVSDHMIYYPTLLALLCVLQLLAPATLLPALGLFLLFVSFNVLAGFATAQVAAALLRKRRSRELILVLSFVLVMALLVGLPFFESQLPRIAALSGWLESGLALLPPQMVGQAYLGLFGGTWSWFPLLGLGLWVAVLLVINYLLFKKQLKQRPQFSGGAVARNKRPWLGLDRGPLAFLPVDLKAMVGKEVRYLFRSLAGRVNFIALPVVTFLIINLVQRRSNAGLGTLAVDDLSLFGVMIYVMMLVSNFVNNIFAFEGAGMRAYFAGPMALSRVILGKNIGLWLYTLPFPFIVLAIWSGMLSFQPLLFLNALLFFALGLLVASMLGNWLSVIFPLAKDPATLNNSAKTAAVLFGLLGLVYQGILVAAVLGLPRLLGLPLELPLLVCLLGIHVVLYRLSLPAIADLMHERREAMIHAFK